MHSWCVIAHKSDLPSAAHLPNVECQQYRQNSQAVHANVSEHGTPTLDATRSSQGHKLSSNDALQTCRVWKQAAATLSAACEAGGSASHTHGSCNDSMHEPGMHWYRHMRAGSLKAHASRRHCRFVQHVQRVKSAYTQNTPNGRLSCAREASYSENAERTHLHKHCCSSQGSS